MLAARTRGPLWAALAFLLLALPAHAVREWYDYYLEATDRLMPAGRWQPALESLQKAVRLKPASALREQTYGLEFIDYLPYYQMAVCQLRLGNPKEALELLRAEEDRGAIRKSDRFRDLQSVRREAEALQGQRLATRAREEAQRLVKEADELAKDGKLDPALARLAQAQGAANTLQDGQLLQSIADRSARIRTEQKRQADAAERAQRLEQLLAEGRALLDQGRGTEAKMRYDQALDLDPRSASALEGQRQANERILANRTHEALVQRLQEGRALYESGRYEAALRPLTEAAADRGLPEAQTLLDQAQKMVDGLRRQRELQRQLDDLTAQGRRMMERRKFPEAQVLFERALALDPGNVVLRDLAGTALDQIGQTILQKWMPNRPPLLEILEPGPAETEVEAPTISVVGVAIDERGLAEIDFALDGHVVRTLAARPASPGEVAGKATFSEEFRLREGLNEITITARDASGLESAQTYRVTRHLRFFERKEFLPLVMAGAVALLGVGWGVQSARRRRAVRKRFNPYIAGAPVMDEAMFFGRQKLLARLLNMLHHNSLMITGERRIGKTTFMYHLRRALELDAATDYQYFPVSIDLQGVAEGSFFYALMADVVEALSLSPDTLAALRFRVGIERYDGRDFSHDLQRVIDELKTRTPRQVKLALLIDEADVLNEYSERTNQRLRSIFMKTFSEHLVAVMSGVGVRRVWKSEGSPWYNFFDEVELQPLAPEEAEALVRQPVDGVFRYDGEAVEAILRESQLKPYVIQKFCIHAINRMIEEGRTTVTPEDVQAVRELVRREGREVEAADFEPAVPA